jgi:4'-phosphopantetheinyl transferase
LPALPPQSLADDEIHLWFFPQWNTPRDAAATPAIQGLLAAYLQRPVTSLRLARGEHGKPYLCDGALQFNLSHSGAALLVGLSRDALGVDLEAPRRERPVLDLAQRWFAPSEAAALARLPVAQQQAAFLRLWTCKEAVLKAHGRGIGHGLDRVEFALSAAGEIEGLREPVQAGSAWHVIQLTPAPAYMAAVAWQGRARSVRGFVTQAIAGSVQSG